jgi:outer membrane immunogenic protein
MGMYNHTQCNRSFLGAYDEKVLACRCCNHRSLGSASAADIYRKAPPPAPPPAAAPAFSWTGCYIGAQGGWGWGRKRFDDTFTRSVNATGQVLDFRAASSDVDTSGPVFGGQIGCDYQFGLGKGFGPGAWVIGIEADALAADINGFDRDAFAVAGFRFNDSRFDRSEIRVKTDFLASVTGRLGYSFWNTGLLYVKGGGAWAHDRFDFTQADNPRDVGGRFGFDVFNIFEESRSGWTVGAGVEWAFAPNWSAKIEWDHYDFGSKSRAASFIPTVGGVPRPDQTAVVTTDIDQRIDTVTIGVNYRFNLFGVGGVGKGKAPVVARY